MMQLQICIFLILEAVLAATNGDVEIFDPRSVQQQSKSLAIVNGKIAKEGQFPYQVFVTNRIINTTMYPFASGSLITTRHVLTAAGVIVPHLKILAGQNDLKVKPGSVIREVVKVTKYDTNRGPSYSSEGPLPKYHDIAILTMDQEVPINNVIKTIPVGIGELKLGTTCIVSGWGYEYEDDITSSSSANLYTNVDVAQCSNSHWKFLKSEEIEAETNAVFCAGNSLGDTTGTCTGDSGGPLVHKGALVGIVSWIHLCGNFYIPGLYTKVSFYADWIKEISDDVKFVNVTQN